MDEIVTPYDLIEIVVDKVVVNARPIEWDSTIVDNEGHNADGSMVRPTKFETACPHCGQMVQFQFGFGSIKCPECKRGEDISNIKLAEIKAQPQINPFQDPGEYMPISVPSSPDKDVSLDELLGEDAKI